MVAPVRTPVVFGACALGAAPPPRCPPDAEIVFADPRVAIYRAGVSRDLQLREDRQRLLLVLGRIYEPAAPAGLRALADGDLKDVQGSFVAFRLLKGPARLSLSTDKFGLRRLLYWCAADHVFFATHLSGLQRLATRLPGLSSDALLHFYNFGFTPNDRTLLHGVRKVPPASTLVVEPGGRVSLASYRPLGRLYRPERFARCSERDLCGEIDRRLLGAVRRRMPGGEPVGVALSGGVDSGYVAQKAVQGGARVIGYNLAYGRVYDEFDRVDRLAQLLGIEVRKISVSPRQVIENFEDANRVGSEPVGFNNATMRFAAGAARDDGVHSLLDGDGTDRLFLGMTRHLQYRRMLRAYRVVAHTGLRPLVTPLLRLLPGAEFKKLHLCFENWRRGIPPYAERGLGRVQAYDADYERRVYELAIARHRRGFERELGGSEDFGLFFTYLAIQMCPEMFFHDPAELHAEFGVAPVPAFFDDDLVSAAVSIPTRWKLRRGKSKYILRKAAARNMDPRYWMLPKIGFQRARHFAVRAPEGRGWYERRLAEVRAAPEAERLAEIVPGGAVDADKLIPLLVWKQQHGI